jgi:hypothetical protein
MLLKKIIFDAIAISGSSMLFFFFLVPSPCHPIRVGRCVLAPCAIDREVSQAAAASNWVCDATEPKKGEGLRFGI